MMHIQSNSFTRRHLLGVCCFYERQWNSPSHITACRVSSPPPCLDKYDGFAYGLKSRSSGITVKRRNEEVVEKHFQELSSSHYEAAMEALSSLITGQKRGEKSAIGGKYDKLKRMEIYLEILGLEEKIAGLKIIHVAGTKGKGSTCAFCEAILRECGFRTGLFTSPHLIDVRERFRIDGLEISEEKFLQYFWQCWDQLKDKVTKELLMPPLFQFLTLLAFKVFVNEKVDVGIFEVGLGGTKDSTNVIKEPVVCGIASLGMDHMETLGDTLGKIASHKAGILKPYTPAFSVLQLPEAMDVIRERASQLVAPLKVVSPLSHEALNGIQLSLAGDHQFINAGLAVSLCKTWLQRTGNWEKLSIDINIWYDNGADLPDAFLRGLSSARLSGRAQIVHDIISKTSNKPSGDLTFYLDGAHSPESVEACAEWFAKAVKEDNDLRSLSSLRTSSLDDCQEACSQNGHPNNVNGSSKICEQVLLFNCMDLRNPQILLPKLVNTCASSGIHFSKALFVPSISTYSKVTSGSSFNPSNLPKRDLRWQFSLQRIWEKIHGNDVDPERNVKMECLRSESVEALLPLEFFRKNSCMQNSDSYHPSSAVIPSLPLTIRWLRDCVKENPSLRLQVLVTGSLHLVGDVLKLLRRR